MDLACWREQCKRDSRGGREGGRVHKCGGHCEIVRCRVGAVAGDHGPDIANKQLKCH